MAARFRYNATVGGMEDTFRRMQIELMGVKRRTYKGMYAAVKHLEHQMDTVRPLVPIDTEFMRRDSWFIDGRDHPTNPTIVAGYTAPYAPIIHEGIIHGRPVKHWTRPGSGPKWLQIHFHRNIEEMKLIVGAHALPVGKSRTPLNYGGISGWSKPISDRQDSERGTFDLNPYVE